jgi:hypothetical protein
VSMLRLQPSWDLFSRWTDTKDPSAEASTLGGRFYFDVWMKGGREVADEAIRKNEKESHDAQEEAKRAEEAAERARLLGTFTEV